MDEFEKYINLIWKVPLAVLLGAVGYVLTKTIVIEMLSNYSHFLAATEITTINTIIPILVPLGCLVWAFGDFIFPPKPPRQPPYIGGPMG